MMHESHGEIGLISEVDEVVEIEATELDLREDMFCCTKMSPIDTSD